MAEAGAPEATTNPEEGAVKLEFQNFGSSGEGAAIDGRIGTGAAPAFKPPVNDSFNDQQSLLPGQDGGQSAQRSWNPFSLATYQYYFDVDTIDVIDRLKKSMSVSSDVFFENSEMRPDMYGPFWLCTTLVFAMAAAGNLGALMSFVPTEQHQVFTYNFDKLTVGSSVLYGYTAFVPLSGWAVSKWLMAQPLGLAELVCIYGYSLAVYIPTAVLCVIPIELLRWFFLVAGFCVSLKFIIRNVKDVLVKQVDESRALMVLVIVGALHGVLALFLKIYFYS
mmetsp:Transcript_15455/g.31165  ORF Transcript_15455/g.31165 Transcript_15455/m.31165 type:complete len:278 (+) Transcript_15455:71-904(+)